MKTDRLEQLLQFLTENPQDSFLKYAIAMEYAKKSENEKALEYYQDLVQNDPEYVGTYYHLGKLYEKLEQFDNAFTAYEQGKKIAKSIGNRHALNELMGAENMLRDELEED